MARTRDLFNDSTMTFGEHLEALREHLWKSVIGILIGVLIALFFGDTIIGVLRTPIDEALRRNNVEQPVDDSVAKVDFWGFLKHLFSDEPKEKEEPPETEPEVIDDAIPDDAMEVQVPVQSLIRALRSAAPELMKDVPKTPTPLIDQPATTDAASAEKKTTKTEATESASPKNVPLIIRSPEIRLFRKTADRFNRPVTFKVEEAFMAYIKISFVAGFTLASPWVFYQLWLFIAAGLHSHERKYVYVYLPMSLVLFVSGALFCFYLVFPIVLDFLISFNQWLGVELTPRLSEYISLVLMLPLMFGISFQLPMVMLFIERIGIFTVEGYRENRRMAVLVISIASMLLTPSDPTSMLLMMLPLIFLYEVGIHLCRFRLGGTADPLA